MKLIKLGFFSILILFTLVTFIGLLFPSKVIVSRAVDISKSPDSIYQYTKDLYGWKLWVNGLKQQSIKSPLETKIGSSTIQIISSKPTEVVGKWTEKNGDIQKTTISLISNQNKTVVHWEFEQNIKWYPWERFSSMINDKVIGSMMEENLANLKKIAESH